MSLKYIMLASAFALTACKPAFNAGAYANTDELFKVATAEYNKHHWDNAVHAFERLTTELSPRDPRIAQAYYYLAKSQEKMGDHLLAAKSYSRVYELLPQDSIADDALLASAKAYQAMWRKPELDAEYGQEALTQYQTFLGYYPDSPLIPAVTEGMAKLDEWFAEKDYNTGIHYLKRKAYDSAIIYFKDVIKLHPTANVTKDAYMRLYEAYRAISYKDDARDLCDTMRKAYPADREVMRICGPAPPAAAAAPPSE
jgi:outer membrane assembly lipoprotein YfiO